MCGHPDDTIPKGNYTFIGLDVDTTGRRLIDEVINLSNLLLFRLLAQ